MSASAVLTAASAVELHVQIHLDRTYVPVTMVTQEMAKPVVCLKVSNGTCIGQYLFRRGQSQLIFSNFQGF